MEDRYIGDGVYASYDGWHIWLDLRGQGDPQIKIALEPSVMDQLIRFAKEATSAAKGAP